MSLSKIRKFLDLNDSHFTKSEAKLTPMYNGNKINILVLLFDNIYIFNMSFVLFRNYLLLSIFLLFIFVLYCIFSLQESQTKQVLGQLMYDIHQEFGLTEKVVATTTDNGSNYRAAFESFGSTSEPLDRPGHSVDDNEEDAEEQLEEDSELIPERESECVSLYDVMSDGSEDAPDIQLPPHHRCRYCV